jgi:hypothetical protein
VIEVTASAPTAFEALAMTVLASCAAAWCASRPITIAAM